MKNKILLYLILLFLINCSQSSDVEKVEPFVSGSSTTTIYSESEQVTFSSCSKWLDLLEKDEDELNLKTLLYGPPYGPLRSSIIIAFSTISITSI